jgi:hypothetical protein
MRKYLAALAFLLVGCGGLNEDFVRSEREVQSIIGPRFSSYVMTDDTLDVDLRDALIRLNDSWHIGLSNAEELIGE